MINVYTDCTGQEWQFVRANSQDVPYFVKVVRGKAQKTEFVVPELETQWKRAYDKD